MSALSLSINTQIELIDYRNIEFSILVSANYKRNLNWFTMTGSKTSRTRLLMLKTFLGLTKNFGI